MQEFVSQYADINLTVSGITMNEPVLVDLLEGKVYADNPTFPASPQKS